MTLAAQGFDVFPPDPRVARWARAARRVAEGVAADPAWHGPDNLRHGRTWFVGVDALPNAADGAIAGVPLAGPWQGLVPDLPLHAAQLSIVYPGYPLRDPSETEAGHRYRRIRMAAHVDGLIPVGPRKRRFAQEFHAYILAIPLTDVRAAPTMVWPRSHVTMHAALRDATAGRRIEDVDLTEAYQAARRAVFTSSDPVALTLETGQAALLHRFLLHGTAPWDEGRDDPEGQGRMTAFFRPEFSGGAADWMARS